jgi:hypothetical protein
MSKTESSIPSEMNYSAKPDYIPMPDFLPEEPKERVWGNDQDSLRSAAAAVAETISSERAARDLNLMRNLEAAGVTSSGQAIQKRLH